MNYANVKDLKLSDSEIYWILLYFYFGLEGHHRNGFFMIVYTGSHYHCHCHSIVQINCCYHYYFCTRVGAEGRDAVIDVLIKVIPKNKLAVELFVKLGGELL